MILLDRQTHLASDVAPSHDAPAAPDSSQAAASSSIPIVPPGPPSQWTDDGLRSAATHVLPFISRRIATLQRRYKELRDFPTLTGNDEISRIRTELIALLNQRAHILRVARAQ